eukprot:gene7922-7337_t
MSEAFFSRDAQKENRRCSMAAGVNQKKPGKARVRQASDITICIRKRPHTKEEMATHQTDVIECGNKQIMVSEHKQKVNLTRYVDQHVFNFDQ